MKARVKQTGKIIDIVRIDYLEDDPVILMEFHTEDGYPDSYTFKSLKELNDTLEDYRLKEPLIKNEKIRKIVRAWAERCNFPIVEHYFSNGFSCFMCTVDDNDYCLDFNLRIDNLDGSKLYTITELCGEEEE